MSSETKMRAAYDQYWARLTPEERARATPWDIWQAAWDLRPRGSEDQTTFIATLKVQLQRALTALRSYDRALADHIESGKP